MPIHPLLTPVLQSLTSQVEPEDKDGQGHAREQGSPPRGPQVRTRNGNLVTPR